MRKHLAAGLLAAGLALTLCACGGTQTAEPAPEETAEAVTETAEESAETEQPQQAPAEEPQQGADVSEADISDCHVVVTGYKVAKDYNNNPIIVVSYDFTNNSSKNQTPIWVVFGKAFQDGVELDLAFSMDKSVYDAGIEQKELQPGASMTGCQKAYALTSTSPVEFYAGDMMSQDEIQMTFDIAQ